MLFIPGNAGTYQQGNGLAAESARQWDRARRRDSGFGGALRDVVNLDWYLVDTREQLSAFHGDVLVSDSTGHGRMGHHTFAVHTSALFLPACGMTA